MAQDWVRPPGSRTAVSNAGIRISSFDSIGLAAIDDVALVQAWRAAHGFPLNTVQNGLRRNARKLSKSPLVSQRLKRLPSIIRKLQRNDLRMQLARMQDVGGCRAVVQTVRQVQNLHMLLSTVGESSRSSYRFKRDCNDYIQTPPLSGYRSLHQVVEFNARPSARSSVWNGLSIEVQLRTGLQHTWATAVEVVDILKQTDIKGGVGPENWMRFFALASSVFALAENTPLVLGTPSDVEDLRKELREFNNQLGALSLLNDYVLTLNVIDRHIVHELRAQRKQYLLITVDAGNHKYDLRPFKVSEFEEAMVAYSELERKVADRPLTDALLVATDSVKLAFDSA